MWLGVVCTAMPVVWRLLGVSALAIVLLVTAAAVSAATVTATTASRRPRWRWKARNMMGLLTGMCGGDAAPG